MTVSEDICTWTAIKDPDSGIIWFSDCGHEYLFEDEGPIGNEFAFCPYCGKRLVEVKE